MLEKEREWKRVVRMLADEVEGWKFKVNGRLMIERQLKIKKQSDLQCR